MTTATQFSTFGKICLIVPTHNRPHFVRRLLSYYKASGAALRLIVIDSSEPSKASLNKELVSKAAESGALKIEYHHSSKRFPPESPPILHEKVQWALEMVDAPYVAMCADDDFLVPSALAKFASYLEQNHDYCCARGRIFDFIATQGGGVRLYPALHLRSVESENACERVWLASRYYQQSFYGLFRLQTLREIQRSLPQSFLRHPGWLDELSFSTFAAVTGKIMRFDCPYEYRELHESNCGHVVSKWPETTFDESLRPFVEDYRKALAELLLRYHPQMDVAAADTAAQASMIAFSKWYYDVRYRDSHYRPKGAGTLERRDLLQRLFEKTNGVLRMVRGEVLRLRAMRYPESRAVMNAVAYYHAWQK